MSGHMQQGPSGKWYEVLPYEEQKKSWRSSPPRGICSVCESNPTLRKDNCIRFHKVRGERCPGSDQPSLGLPPQYR